MILQYIGSSNGAFNSTWDTPFLVPAEVMGNCKALLAFSLYGKGKGLMDKHEFDQAALCFTNALDVCPPSVDKTQLQVAFTYRAYCLYCSGKELLRSGDYALATAKFKADLVALAVRSLYFSTSTAVHSIRPQVIRASLSAVFNLEQSMRKRLMSLPTGR